ncbi:ubiquitin-related domain-containing protein [Amanita rubescens]|nr:ubiquitin-related domain-containing protein [Amanita rubescens]
MASSSGISPSSSPHQSQPSAVPQTPQTFITFLLVTGRRRTMSFEPGTTIGRVKELVWNTWPEDNEWKSERPPAPSYLRLLYLGKMLQDDDTLTKLKLPASNTTSPQGTIVHLSIRPYAPTGETEGLNKKRRLPRRLSGDGDDVMEPSLTDSFTETSDSSGCCGCIIC